MVRRWEILQGDVRETLRALEAGSVQTCVTSPPYFGLRDYGVDGQIGLEPTPAEYVEQMVAVFREVRRVLRDDGTLWLNLGDSYNAAGREGHGTRQGCKQGSNRASATKADNCRPSVADLKPKDLIGIPWRVAFALQQDGWYLRQDIIWHKPNPMPESVRDRCTKAHEYLFLLSKSERYFWDAEAMQEPAKAAHIGEMDGGAQRLPNGSNANDGRNFRAGRSGNKQRKPATARDCPNEGVAGSVPWEGFTRNRRSVWTVATRPYKGAHFATFPPTLIEPCILAGAPFNGLVLDPFTGSGTTAAVALQHGRRFIGCELNPDYINLAEARIAAAEAEVLW